MAAAVALVAVAVAGCAGPAAPGSAPGPTPARTTPAVTGAGVPAAPGSTAEAAGGVYLALGDSLAAGVGAPSGAGYVDRVHADLAAGAAGVELVNLGVSGETTGSMLAPGGQLERAERVLRDRRGEVRLVTIDIGANDGWVCAVSLDPACLERAGSAVQANLGTILDRLRQAGGEDVPIVGMDYYLPVAPQLRDDPARLAAALALGSALNDGLAQAYASRGVPVARVAEAFGGSDPRRVLEVACGYTGMCGSPPDIHPTAEGYAMIAEAVLAVVPPAG